MDVDKNLRIMAIKMTLSTILQLYHSDSSIGGRNNLLQKKKPSIEGQTIQWPKDNNKKTNNDLQNQRSSNVNPTEIHR